MKQWNALYALLCYYVLLDRYLQLEHDAISECKLCCVLYLCKCCTLCSMVSTHKYVMKKLFCSKWWWGTNATNFHKKKLWYECNQQLKCKCIETDNYELKTYVSHDILYSQTAVICGIFTFIPCSMLICASDWLTTVIYRGISHIWLHQREI